MKAIHIINLKTVVYAICIKLTLEKNNKAFDEVIRYQYCSGMKTPFCARFFMRFAFL